MNRDFKHIITPILATIWFVAVWIGLIVRGITPHTINLEGLVAIKNSFFTIPTVLYTSIGAIFSISLAFFITRIATFFPLIKVRTFLPVLFFLLFQLLCPPLVEGVTIGLLTAIFASISIFILYMSYQQKYAVEKGFIMAFLYGIASIFYGRILYLLPAFVIGMSLMRASSVRTYAAMIIGLITPYWIIWGTGWIEGTFLDFSSLDIVFRLPTLSIDILPPLCVILLGFITGINNLIKAYNESIQTRAFNGFITILSVYTALLLCIDNIHYMAYLPLLNICVSLQCAYFFSTHNKRIHTLLLYSLIILFIAWQIWIYLSY